MFLIAINAAINKKAVKPLIPAYIGGKKDKSTPLILTLKRSATAIGITMDNTLLSLEQSPLYQSILQDSNYQDFIYSLQESLGALSKHRVEIPFSDFKENTSTTFDLPRYGLVYLYRMPCHLSMTGGRCHRRPHVSPNTTPNYRDE